MSRVALLASAALCSAAQGQLSIPWHTTDSGGGATGGGAFTLTGTIAQPDASAPMTGGAFTLAGGFWFVTPPSTCPADLGIQGGLEGQDGQLNNNDFVVFINYFFSHDPRADVGVQGGLPGSDAQWDNNDFVIYIDLFFAGCP